MPTIPAHVSGAMEVLREYGEELLRGGEPQYPHEAAQIVAEYQESLTRQLEAIGQKETV